MSKKLSSSIRYEKVELGSPREVVKPRDGNCTGNDTSKRIKRDSLSYKERMGSGASKAKVSGSHKKLSAINAEARKKVKGKVVKSQPSSSKKRRVENAKQGNILHTVFPVQDGKESITELNKVQTEDSTSGVLEKEPQFENITGDVHNVCVTCMLGGKLLSCVGKGCKRKYHPACLVPFLSNVPLGFWHCIWCVKKKKELGVHSVSEVTSILDAREVLSDSKVMQSEKQYLVKYRGLAHVHNRWIPEKELLSEARALVKEYNSKNQVVRWKPEWTIPNRLLQKRELLFPTNSDKNNLDCVNEWLVKWTGLGYEQATWELESASFLTSPESMKLIRDFEIRHQKSESSSSYCEEEEKEKCITSELSKLSFGGSPGDYGRYLSYVNKLLAHWHKNQNAVVYDDQVDQERVIKVILFVLSLQSTARRPFLIISQSTTLSVWESEFLHVAPSANIIVYKGSKDVRSSIRSLEFYNKSGSVMFEILLSDSDIVAEDLDKLKCIRWGAIVIDGCQRPGMSKYFEQFKSLRADMKLLLVSGEIKECSADYQNMLSLLDSGYELSSGNVTIDSDADVCKLKERFAQYFAFECKSSSPTFLEYWVPVQLSYLQLEQYCNTLLSNSRLLSSSWKIDDALRELVISFRKCCDHPYLLDQSFQGIATEGLSAEEVLDVGIKVSGKLQILDKILLETKARGLRVLILFQSVGGSGRDSVGNILDDFLCQRFGKYSHVRVDGGRYGGSKVSKKKAYINMFNAKENGRQFLLLEDRACHASIKLSAVDVVVLFNSDCKPQNDMKALHRISISSQFEQLKVFRLYSAFTVEENFLILAKNGTSLDSNIQTLGRNSCHKLLSWGASCLFNKLDDFHDSAKSVSVSNVSCEQSFLNAVLSELLTQLPCSGNHSGKCNFITEVPQNVVYDRNISSFGEKEIGSVSYESSVPSLIKLLEGMPVPEWKLLSKSSTRNRKKVQYFDNSPLKPEVRDGGVIKKGKIAVNGIDDPTYPEWKFKGKRNATVASKKRKLIEVSYNASKKISPRSTDGKKDLNKSNLLLLKLGISKLCEVLQLPENVRGIAVSFLQYIMQDYDVSCESASSMQAYQISLCWTAADLLKHKLNQKESLALAKQLLNLDCRDEEVEYIYSELQGVSKKFAQCSEEIKGYMKSNYSKSVRNNPQCNVHKTLPSTPSRNQTETVRSASPQDPDESLTENTLSSLPMKTVIELESDSQEHQSPIRMPVANSVAEPSEIPQAQCSTVATCNDRMRTNDATQSNKESVETYALISERATVSEVGQHDSAVDHPPGDSNASDFSGSVESLLETYVNSIESNLLQCQEPACSNPLQIELERIQKIKEQTLKLHVDKILWLKSERDKEIKEVYRKYDVLLQDAEMSFKQKEQDLESYCSKVNFNDLLAETLMFSQSDEVAGSPVISQLVQQPTPMLDPQFEPSSTGLGALPPGQISNHPLPAVAPDYGSAIVAQSNSVVIRAAAPHLRVPNPRSMPIPHISDPHISYSHGMTHHQLSPNQLSTSNPQTIPVSLPHVAPGLHSEIAPEMPVFNSYVPPLEETVDISNHASPDLQIS